MEVERGICENNKREELSFSEIVMSFSSEICEFKRVRHPKSWVWKWFDKSPLAARCTLCLKVLKTDRTTSCLIRHLLTQHAITKESLALGDSPHEEPSSSGTQWNQPALEFSAQGESSSSLALLNCSLLGNIKEEPQPLMLGIERPPRTEKKRQLQMETFFSKKNSLKTDVLRLICEDNVTMNQVVNSRTIRRLLSQNYPSEAPLPTSGATLTEYLRVAGAEAREKLRIALSNIVAKGSKLCISLNEGTMLGSNRFSALNVHHHEELLGNSRVAALGLLRTDERATGYFLCDAISSRLHSVGLTMKDIAIAATNGSSNVLRALTLLGVGKQQCFAHALDLVVRKAIYKNHSLLFDASILTATAEQADLEAEAETEFESDVASEDEADSERECVADSFGALVERVRSIVRDLKKNTVMMNEIRWITARPEFNGKELCPLLDSPTRWYSTLIMLERTLEIFPALRDVVSRYTIPLSDADFSALKEIVGVLAPFRRGIVMLCEAQATLLSADRVFTLILRELRESQSDLAGVLYDGLKNEISRRRTCLSSALALLDNPRYNFYLEAEIGVSRPSDDDILEALTSVVDVETDLFLSESDEEDKPKVTWDSVLATPSTSNSRENRQDSCTIEKLRKELLFHKAGEGRGRFLTLCHRTLLAVPATSVQSERDSSTVKDLLGENRGRITPQTLDDIFVLKKLFASDAI